MFLVLPLVAAFVLAACGGSDDSESSESSSNSPVPGDSRIEFTQVEDDYLTQVDGAFALFATKAAVFRTLLSQAWPTNERLFEALYDAGAGTARVESLAAVEKLEPPPSLRDDHAHLLAFLEEAVRIDAEIGEKVKDADVVAFMVLNSEMGVAAALKNAKLTPLVCQRLFNADGQNPSCRSPEQLAGGEYGLELEVLILRYEAGIGGRLGLFGPTAADEERLAGMALVLPEIVRTIEDALAETAGLEPPEDLRADHALLVQYLADQLALAQVAASAVSTGDAEALDQFVGNALALHCETRASLSEEAIAIAHGHFEVDIPCSELGP